jgi:hypothetical protein
MIIGKILIGKKIPDIKYQGFLRSITVFKLKKHHSENTQKLKSI